METREPGAPIRQASPPRSTAVNVAFALGAIFTAFDAIATYVWVAVLNIATEANPMLAAIGDSVGFGGAMIFRAIIGLGALTLLWMLARTQTRARKVASQGVILAAVVFGGIAAYHLWGLAYTTWPELVK